MRSFQASINRNRRSGNRLADGVRERREARFARAGHGMLPPRFAAGAPQSTVTTPVHGLRMTVTAGRAPGEFLS